MAYASEIDIKISETPKTTDPELLPDLIDIYNALHILAQYTDQIREFVTKSPEGDPWESFPLENIVHVRAHVSISQGQICGPAYLFKSNDNPNTTSTVHAVVRGVPYLAPYARDLRTGRVRNYQYLHQTVNGVVGIALEDTSAGDLVPIALGPGVLEVPGLRAGESVFAWSAYEIVAPRGTTYLRLRNNGSLFRLSLTPERYADTSFMHRVGVGIAQDAMYLFPSPLTQQASNIGLITTPAPPGEQHQGG